MMKTFVGVLLFVFFFLTSKGQINVSALNTSFTQNFDGMVNAQTATLPNGFVVDAGSNYLAGTNTTTQAKGTSGSDMLNGSSDGGIYNFANGATATSTDRSLGFLSSGSFSSPRSIMLQVTNSTGSSITSFSIAFDYEKYRSGSRAFDFTFFHGLDGVNWTAEPGGSENFAADPTNNTVFNPPASRGKSITIGGINIPSGSSYYFRWTYTGNGGSTNGQAIGIDNFSITAFTGSVTPSNPTDHFRTKQSGDWGAASTWESSSNGLNWINATLIPTSNANTITIMPGHTVNMVSDVSADQLTIQAGGVLNHSHTITFTLHDFTGDDMIINGTYVVNGAIPSGTGKYVVNAGGVIRVDANTGGNADNLAFSENDRVLFKTGSVFQWNTNVIFETVGINYFLLDPDENEKPIFRISSNNLNVGSNSSTTINGLLDITGSVLWTGTGSKTFRDGITGTGNITQTEDGIFRITGRSAVLGITNPLSSITLSPGGGLEIVSGSQVELIANSKVNGAVFTNRGIFYCEAFIISGSTSFVNAINATLGIGSANGITSGTTTEGNIQTSGIRTFNSNATYIYNGATNQVTGNGLPLSVQVLSISSFGTSGNNKVTLTRSNTTVNRLNLNNGSFVAGINGNLNIADGGVITGGDGFQPNVAEAGTITFLGAGRTEGIGDNKPSLYAVIIEGAVDFNGILGSGSAKILNRLQINSGGSVANDPPYYQTGSTLIYNTGTGSRFARGVEWGSAKDLQGYPHHVLVQNSILDLFNSDFPAGVLEIAGNLIIGNAHGRGEVYMNNGMNKPLSVLGNIIIGSAGATSSVLQLSSNLGGNLWLGGSFTRYNNSSFNPINRAVYFKGSNPATISTPGVSTPGVSSQDFHNLRLEKTGGASVSLECAIGITNELTFTSGYIISSSSNLLIFNDNASATGAKSTSFTNGPVKKIGDDAFVFPVGKPELAGPAGGGYRYVGISAPLLTTDAFTAEFMVASATALGPLGAAAISAGLTRVSRCEYWKLDRSAGSSNVDVTLSWNTRSNCNVSYISDLPTLAIAHFNGTVWDLFGGKGNTSPVSTETEGSITWTGVANFSRFSLASTDYLENLLPLNLSSFTARARKTNVAIDWMLTNNNDYDEFMLERSKDGFRFETLKVVKAKVILNTAAYAEEDRAPFTGWNYYRLRAINKVGKETVSQIVKVWFGREDVIRISPNPASEKILINFAEPSSISQIELVNIAGQVLQRTQTITFNTEINIAHLQAGMYVLRITGKNGLSTKSFIKQ